MKDPCRSRTALVDPELALYIGRMILAGDIGGTKVDLAFCEARGGRVTTRARRRYPSAGFPGLADVLRRYLSEAGEAPGQITAVCFGVPGPVLDGCFRGVNLPWAIDERELGAWLRALGAGAEDRRVRLINDLEAMARGIRALPEDGVAVLRAGSGPPAAGNRAVLAAGTGLGEAIIHGDDAVSASEGGHCDFGPQNEEQIELLRWLWQRHKHASVEHVASGSAIHRLYRFLKETGRESEPEGLALALGRPGIDPSPLIARLALKHGPRICARTMELWLSCLGAEAGNLALKALSLGGLYLGGGVVPGLLELFREGPFFAGLESKGRISGLLDGMPVYAILDPDTALYGAALAAAAA